MKPMLLLFLCGLVGCITPIDEVVESDAGADVREDPDPADIDPPESEFLCQANDDGLRSVTYDSRTLQVQCWSAHGGGWLLVGRSGLTADPQPFGWTSTSGTLAGAPPYSLGAALDFDEILVTSGPREGQREQQFDAVLKLRVPPSFFDYQAQSSMVTFDGQLQGSCSLTEVPSMFANVGYVSGPKLFWFRDKDEFELYGLGPGGWQLNTVGECQADGGFGDTHGAIYVRARKEAQ